MAKESGFITLEDLKRQAEEIGLEGKKKTKFLTQGWKMQCRNNSTLGPPKKPFQVPNT